MATLRLGTDFFVADVLLRWFARTAFFFGAIFLRVGMGIFFFYTVMFILVIYTIRIGLDSVCVNIAALTFDKKRSPKFVV